MLWHHLFAFAAILVGGVVTDRFVRRMPRFRLGFQAVSMLCGAPCLVAVGFVPSAAATRQGATATQTRFRPSAYQVVSRTRIVYTMEHESE